MAARQFKPSLHPRDRFGRFTRSRSADATSAERQRAAAVAQALRPRRGAAGANAGGYLATLAGASDGGAVSAYTAGGYVDTHKALRAGKIDEPSVQAMDTAMIELPDDLIVSRRVPATQFGNVDVDELLGLKVRDAAYTPTSIGAVRATKGDVRLRIAVPAGTRAAVNPDTGEVILDRDLEMVVARVERNPAGNSDVFLTVLPKPGPRTADVAKAETPNPAKKAAPKRATPADDERPEGADEARAELMKLKVPGLQAQMRARGLKPGRMRKSQMVDALVADETGEQGASEEPGGSGPGPEPAPVDSAEQRIRSVVDEIIRSDGGNDGDWVSITQLRTQLPDLDKAEFDAAVRALHKQPGVNVEGRPDRWALNQRDHDAAVTIAGEPRHLIAIRPVQSTTPDPSSGKDAPPERAALQAAPIGMDRPAGASGLTARMRRHLTAYRTGSDGLINEALRDPNTPAPAAQQHQIAGIDEAMAASKLTSDVQVFRGVRNPTAMFGDRLSGDLTGMQWREDAYVSSSAVRTVAADFAEGADSVGLVMNISVPAGTGGVELSPVTFGAELLLDRGHTFRVTADRGVVDGVRVVDVEVLPKGAA